MKKLRQNVKKFSDNYVFIRCVHHNLIKKCFCSKLFDYSNLNFCGKLPQLKYSKMYDKFVFFKGKSDNLRLFKVEWYIFIFLRIIVHFCDNLILEHSFNTQKFDVVMVFLSFFLVYYFEGSKITQSNLRVTICSFTLMLNYAPSIHSILCLYLLFLTFHQNI